MEGTVLHFDESTKKGVIRSEAGDRFDFNDSGWKSNSTPRAGAKVDFMPSDNVATEIYVVSSPNTSVNVAEKLSDFQSSDLGRKVGALFDNGMHNKLGFITAVVVLISLFLPIIEIPLLGKGSLINDGTGKLLFVLLVVLAIFFYGGVTRLYTRILGGSVLAILFFHYYELFSGLNQANNIFGTFGGRKNAPNFFSLVQWGAFVNIVACVVLFLATFVKGYTKNDKTI